MTPPDPDAMTPADSPLRFADVPAIYGDLHTADVSEGDPAPAFTLPLMDFSTGYRQDTGRTVSLADHRGERPVALIFGSYT